VDDLARDRVRQRDVRADVQAEPAVGPLRGRRAPGIDDVELRAAVDAFEDVMEEDRMRFPRVGSP